MIELRPEDTKERKAKEVPIIDEIYPILCDLCEKTPGNGRIFSVTKNQFIEDVRNAANKIGLPYGRRRKDGFTAHSLRHTFNTNAMRANIPQAINMRISGHSNTETSLRCTHPQAQDLRVAMEKINEFVKKGEIVSAGEASPVLMTLLEEVRAEVRALAKNVDKTLAKPPFQEEKQLSDVSRNSLN